MAKILDNQFFTGLTSIHRTIEIAVVWTFKTRNDELFLQSNTLNGAWIEITPDALHMQFPNGGSIIFNSGLDMVKKMSLGEKWLRNHLLGVERGYPIESEEIR